MFEFCTRNTSIGVLDIEMNSVLTVKDGIEMVGFAGASIYFIVHCAIEYRSKLSLFNELCRWISKAAVWIRFWWLKRRGSELCHQHSTRIWFFFVISLGDSS